MANADNIALVIQSILGEISHTAEEDIGFNMATYGGYADASLGDKMRRGCGSVACIAGHAYLLANPFGIRKMIDTDADEIEQVAANFLGIDGDDIPHLFYDLPGLQSLDSVTAEQAIDTLSRLAATGVVEWRLQEIP